MYEVRYYFKRKEKKPSFVSRLLRILMLLFVFLFTINILINRYVYNKTLATSVLVSPLAEKIIHNTVVYLNSRENSEKINSIVNETLGENKNNYAIYIKNLKTGERYFMNENKQFDSASLYKLWVMAETYEQIKEGNLKDTDVLGASISSLNEKFNISSESAELSEGDLSYSINYALEKMITISDNYSALLLSSKIGLKNVSSFLEKNGFSESRVGQSDSLPITSARDVALFFEKLYNKELIDKNYSDKMLSLLKNQQINTKLTKDLSEDVIVAHKTGELNQVSHDGGIVFTSKGDYIIVVMSKTVAPLAANEKIANISEKIYNYFN